jgi:hypothetical protein
MHSMGLIMHIGIGGVLGILIGTVLMVTGLLLWFNPAQRIFCSIVAVLVAVAALIASNLGGFLIGTLLGVVGGSMGFAWTPLQPGTVARSWWRRTPRKPAGAITSPPGHPGDAAEPSGPGDPAAGHDRGTVVRGYALLPILAILAGLLHLGSASSTQSPDPPAAATPAANCSPAPPTIPLPLPLPLPTPSPSCSSPVAASPAPMPGATQAPGSSASLGSSAAPRPSSSPSPSSAPSNGTAPPFAISTSRSSLTASSALITGFAYDGPVSVRTATGTEQMMQFSASSFDLSGVQLTVSQASATITTTAAALRLTGHVVLYATELSGDLVLAGVAVPVTLTPNSPVSAVLQFLGDVGASQGVPLQMKNVTTMQPYTSADGMSAAALRIT